MNLKNKTILITGIGSFIGWRAAELARERGMKVRGLQHSKNNLKTLKQQLGAEVIVGSVNNPVAARKACQGATIVLHTAGVTQENNSLEQLRAVDVGGTINMAKVAMHSGVKAFVHLSSGMVYGFNYPDHVTEGGPLCREDNLYCQTKIEAEQKLLQLNKPRNFGIIIIRPGDVYGPGSIPWIVRPLLLMRKGLFLLANGGKGVMNHVYIDNLIEAIFLSLEKEAYGEIFNITDGQETSWKEYFTRLAEIADLPAPLSMPASLIRLPIKLRRFGQKLLGENIDTLPTSVDLLTRPYAYSVEKAQSQLSYKPKISLEEGLKRTQEWLRKADIQNLIGDR
ncbi:MAG: NAD-dependent epimerase/dehydratase family protein [Symploca sp. SIO2B6]|nr:NAD-dependent epimerase/dehydratase family protein [Symploca sp. SIO2B6]